MGPDLLQLFHSQHGVIIYHDFESSLKFMVGWARIKFEAHQ